MSTSSSRTKSRKTSRQDADLPDAFHCLFEPARFKVFHGGRGGAKSWSIARALVLLTVQRSLRVLIAREFAVSTGDSVHRLLSDQIYELGLQAYFTITDKEITCPLTGSLFLFKGLKSVRELKSTEGIDICWVEEAQTVPAQSWELLIPTIRKEGSEIWISFNPNEEDDATYKRFVANPPPDAVVRKVGWEDNPWFPQVLERERLYMRSLDLEAYEHIWGGNPKTITDAVIFGRRTSVEAFETPIDARFFFGADWGFSTDPTALVRTFMQDDCLFIDQEAFGHGVEIDETPQLFDSVDGARKWPIKADSARPETISFLRRQGFNITGAEKWPGSVEDGIAHLKAFKKIVIHERCKHMQEERRLYRYKVDPKTQQVLPVIVDKFNHGWDAVRYSLDGYIQRRGTNSVWAKLAK